MALDGCVNRFELSFGNKLLSHAAPAIRKAMLGAVAAAQSRYTRCPFVAGRTNVPFTALWPTPTSRPRTVLSGERDHPGGVRHSAENWSLAAFQVRVY